MDNNELSAVLMDRIMFALMESGVSDLNKIKTKLTVIMSDYRIEPKEEALVVWTEGKNEYFLKRFLLAKAVAGCTERTLKYYRTSLERIFREIGRDADTISSLDIQAFLAKSIQRSSTANADNYRRCLSSFYGWCQREELILKNPMSKIECIKVRKKEKHALSDLECELIRDACETSRERAMIDMMLSTGCRVSELVSIKVSDIEGNKINVLGKGDKYRNVYLNAKAQVSIKNYLAERKDKNPYLFPRSTANMREDKFGKLRKDGANWYKDPANVHPDQPCDKGTIEIICRKLGRKTGIENVHPHRFRRTCATSALNHGMPIEQVSKMLGHAQLSTTQVYLDLGERGLEMAHERYVT